MSFTLGKNVKLTVSGASHAPKIGVTLTNIPEGKTVDMDKVKELLKRRAGGNGVYTTARKEADEPVIISGIVDGITTGDTIEAEFINSNVRRGDYDRLKFVPRPSHADYAAYVKYNGQIDLSGGGFFSGRMTLPMCFAGAIVKQFLEQEGIFIGAHILSVGDLCDKSFDPVSEEQEELSDCDVPVINNEAGAKMIDLMSSVSADGDSIGGVIECKITGMPVGIGEPIYDSLESMLSYGMFGIPAVKGIEFGAGFDITRMRGSRANDGFAMEGNSVKCISNNSGGIQGGMSNGMPILFRVAVKPTPSIYKEQRSVDLIAGTDTNIKIEGRHDACIVPRAVPCVEAMSALVLYDAMTLTD